MGLMEIHKYTMSPKTILIHMGHVLKDYYSKEVSAEYVVGCLAGMIEADTRISDDVKDIELIKQLDAQGE